MLYAYQYKASNELKYKSQMKYYSGFFFIFVVFGLISILLAGLNIGLRFGVPGFIYAFVGIPCYFYGRKYSHLVEKEEYFD